MKITLERFGGLAGVPARPLVVDTNSLAQPAAAELEALATHALQSVPSAPGARGTKPDSFAYELTVEDANGSRVLAFDYEHANDEVKRFVSALRAQAKPTPT
jgi:hypothetical protein